MAIWFPGKKVANLHKGRRKIVHRESGGKMRGVPLVKFGGQRNLWFPKNESTRRKRGGLRSEKSSRMNKRKTNFTCLSGKNHIFQDRKTGIT